MGIFTKEIEVTLSGINIKYYENLGYEIPRRKIGSRICMPRGAKITVKIEDVQKYSNVPIEIECDNCKEIHPSTMNNYTKHNRDGKIYCKLCALKLFNSKENHFRYKPEIPLEQRIKGRYTEGYYEFVRNVLKRDNYTCFCCKNKVKYPEVHHLDGYNWCVEKRTDDTNAVTLCSSCHSNFHSKYGMGNNTRKQFEEWIGNAIKELEKFDGKLSPARKIYCYEEDKIYIGVTNFCYTHQSVSATNVYSVCNNKKGAKTVCGGLHVFWYDEYIHMTKKDILKRLNDKPKRNKKSVICLTTGETYESIRAASIATDTCTSSISGCCNNLYKYATSKLLGRTHWMFYEDYLIKNNKEANESKTNEQKVGK